MNSRMPFIIKLKTPKSHFIYDVNTNRILLVSPSMFDIVDLYWSCSKNEIIHKLGNQHTLQNLEEGYARIHEMAEEYKLFSPNRLMRRVGYPTENEVERQLDEGVGQLILEVTQACNMRCKYCAFSGGYPYNRKHNSSYMNLEIARQAVDFYITQNRNINDDLSIGFYGGEPLLNYKLVREVIEYIKFLHLDKLVNYHITTNATLLTKDIIRYFVDNRVAITISLDGPQKDHDRNRIMANGRGSFINVMDNIKTIYYSDPKYYENNITFSCVDTLASDLRAMNQLFINEQELFKQGHLTVSGVASGNTKFFKNIQRNNNRDEDFNMFYKVFTETHIGLTKYNLIFISNFFEKDLIKIHKRMIRSEPVEHEVISPACFPGSRKVFVSVNGDLHICERINRHFPIGNIYSGYDIHRLTQIIHEFCELMNSEKCLNCEAVRFCDHCYASLAIDGKFSTEIMKETCESIQRDFKAALYTYCYIWENNHNAWDYMNDIVVK